MGRKLEDEYKPIRIMEFDAWFILFCEIVTENHAMIKNADILNSSYKYAKKDDKEYRVYKGSIPVSLDSRQMFLLCEETDDKELMVPHYISGGALKCSDAIINISYLKNPSIATALKAKRFAISDENISLKKMPTWFKNEKLWNCYKTFNKACLENNKTYEIEKKAKYEVTRLKREIIELKRTQESSKKESKKLKALEKELDAAKKNKEDAEKARIGSMSLLTYCLNDLFAIYKAQMGIESIREYFYRKGISVYDGDKVRHYKMYKRSASKAKQGKCLFLWEVIYEKMLDWSWMDLRFKDDEEYDLTSLKAYESLVNSGIQGVIDIDPESILLLDSVESPAISGNRRICIASAELVGGEDRTIYKLVSQEEYKQIKGKEYNKHNKIWDGQALLDESVFASAKFDKNDPHGMMLLRNKFFKACAFNTKIQEYYKKHKVSHVVDMFGRTVPASRIKMIVTIDSLKFVDKFYDARFCTKNQEVFTFDGDNELEKKKTAFDYWKNNISREFGIVKTEHASYMGRGKYHRAGYQILNTLPLSKEEVKELLSEDIIYINRLKTDEAVFLNHISNTCNTLRANYYIYNFYKYFENFQYTEDFKDFRNEQISKYKAKLTNYGKVAIKGDFYVLCSMPMEMLEYSVKRDMKKVNVIIQKRDRVYIKGLPDKADVTLFRYPHMSSGSVCALKNCNNQKTQEIDKWFNFDNRDGTNIVVLWPWNSNIMVRLGGADFDSDTALFIKNSVIRKSAEKLLTIKALQPEERELPVVEIDDELKGSTIKKIYDYENLAVLDEELSQSQRRIGELSNLAQLFNSYFWEGYFNKKELGYLIKVYECVLLLSALNELEIDSAKHFISEDIFSLKDNVVNATYDGEMILKKEPGEKGTLVRCKPAFMQEKKRDVKYWKCPMDYISLVLSEKFKRGGSNTKRITFNEFFDPLLPEDPAEELSPKGKKAINDIRERLLALLEQQSINNKSNKGDYSDDDKGENEVDVEQDIIALLEQIKKKKFDENSIIKMYKVPNETYKNYAKDHKKGDLKHPELVEDDTIRQSYYGVVLASSDKAIALLEPDICREELTRDKKKREKGDSREVEIWGETYYYCKEDKYEGIIVRKEKK